MSENKQNLAFINYRYKIYWMHVTSTDYYLIVKSIDSLFH